MCTKRQHQVEEDEEDKVIARKKPAKQGSTLLLASDTSNGELELTVLCSCLRSCPLIFSLVRAVAAEHHLSCVPNRVPTALASLFVCLSVCLSERPLATLSLTLTLCRSSSFIAH